MINSRKELIKILFSHQDLKYRDFSKRLIKTKYELIGVRLPILKKISKDLNIKVLDLFKGGDFKYFEEIMVYGFSINNLKDDIMRLYHIKNYLKYVDNWSLVDSPGSYWKFINKNKDYYFKYIVKTLNHRSEYKRRMAILLAMNYYLDDQHFDLVLKSFDKGGNNNYYVKMMIGWYLATSYIKYHKEVFNYLKSMKNDNEIKKIAIKKINESYRISDKLKAKVRKLLNE